MKLDGCSRECRINMPSARATTKAAVTSSALASNTMSGLTLCQLKDAFTFRLAQIGAAPFFDCTEMRFVTGRIIRGYSVASPRRTRLGQVPDSLLARADELIE